MSHSRNVDSPELVAEFRTSTSHLAGAVPMTVASLSVRPSLDGSLTELTTCALGSARVPEPFTIGDQALKWLEANRRPLVLEVLGAHHRAGFYRPFVDRGIRSAIIMPVMPAGVIVGTVTIGTNQLRAYTKKHLNIIGMLCRELAPLFPHPGESAPPAIEAEEPVAAPASADENTRAAIESIPSATPIPTASTQEAQVESVPSETPTPTASTQEAQIEADSLGRIARWDKTAEGIFGWSASEVVGTVLTLFYRKKHRNLLDPTLRKDLLSEGTFRGRAICYDNKGTPVTCEIELSELEGTKQSRGFRGRFRRVKPDTLLPREKIEFGFAKLFDFSSSLGE